MRSASAGGQWSAATNRGLERLDRLGLAMRRDWSLAPFTTYRVGGPAAGFLSVTAVAELESVRTIVAEGDLAVLVVGNGSNLLVADRGFDGLALHLSDSFAEISIGEAVVDEAGTGAGLIPVRLGAATLLPVAARATVRAGLAGFEWAVGVPGSVGGAVCMNAGGHGSDMATSLTRCSVFNLRAGGPTEWTASDLAFGYRHSALGPDDLVLYAELALAPGDRTASEAVLTEIVRWRREHQPGGSNAGSVFANPDGVSAGRLIDEAGLKGFRIGTAAVSTKHANFIQADADGSADDVHRVLRHVQRAVLEQYGIALRSENRLIGFDQITDDDQSEVAR